MSMNRVFKNKESRDRYIGAHCPRLAVAISSGAVRDGRDAGELIGTAADGTVVQIGTVYDTRGCDVAESYLSANPTPDKW